MKKSQSANLFIKQALLFVAVAAVPVSAQWRGIGNEPVRPTGFAGIGFSTPVNPLANRLDAGWNFAGGAGVTQQYVGVTVDAMFNNFGINHSTLAPVGALHGSQKYWAVTVNPMFHVNDRGPVDFYVTGGLGIYGRHTSLRTTGGGQSNGFELVRTDDLYRPGVNVGAGFAVSFDERSAVKIFVEARYHHMFTPGSDATFIPVTVGVRF